MTILLVLIPLGVVLLGLAVALFVWAVRHGQFEDLEGEGARILFEDPPVSRPVAVRSEAARSAIGTGEGG
jgi:cbb3-type cytochrome oxidase maturation protein